MPLFISILSRYCKRLSVSLVILESIQNKQQKRKRLGCWWQLLSEGSRTGSIGLAPLKSLFSRGWQILSTSAIRKLSKLRKLIPQNTGMCKPVLLLSASWNQASSREQTVSFSKCSTEPQQIKPPESWTF